MPFLKKINLEQKIRILYIIHSLNIGGSEKVLIDSVNGLSPDKYEIEILSLNEYNPEKSIFRICPKPENVKITYIDFEFHQDYTLLGYVKVLFRKKDAYNTFDKINSEIKTFNPRIIHFHTGPRELHLQKLFDSKAVCVFTDHTLRITKHELGVLRAKLLSRVFRKLYSGFNLITVSPQIQKNLLEYSIPDLTKRNIVLPNNVDTDRFKRKSDLNLSGELNAVYISRIDNNKGHEELIRAWAGLNDIPRRKLFLVGPDHLNGKIQKLAKELDCSDMIAFTGSVSDTREILETCNLGIFPSHKEGLPLSLLEKMSMSLPLVISDIPELRSVCTNQHDAIFYGVGNAEGLSDAIRSVYFDPELAKKLGKNARQTVLEKYSASSAHTLLDNFYTSILD